MTAAHLPSDTPSTPPRPSPALGADIRQRMQDQQVDKLKQSGVPKKLSPAEAMQMLRYSSPETPTTWEYKYRALFLETFPEAKASVEKFQSAPGCGCRRQLQTIITLKHVEVTNILEKVYGGRIYEVDDTKSDAAKSAHVRTPAGTASLVGKTVLIDPNTHAYTMYMKTVNRATVRPYTGLSVVPLPDGTKWAILFW